MKLIYRALILVVTLGAIGVNSRAWAQSDLPDEPYSKWSKSEVEKVLNDSPWVSVQEVRIRRQGGAQRVAGAPPSLTRDETNSVASSGSDVPIDFIFTLRLRSGLPVREALVRQKQLEAKYDTMDQKQKDAFDAGLKGLLECPACANNYVLTLSSKSKNSPGADAVYTTFKGAKLEDVKRYIYIANEHGQRRELVHIVPPRAPGDEAVFFFPRLDNEELPLFTTDSKEIIVNLNNNEVNISTNFRIDAPKLVQKGQLLF